MPDIRTNMIAQVKIKDYATAGAIVVPINTIQNSEEGNYVYTATKSAEGRYMATKQLVALGVASGDVMEIKNGLKSGDMLITTGFQNINAGQYVKF